MSINKKDILYWCSSIEDQFNPRETIPRGETPKQIPEQFLAAAIRYMRALCDSEKEE